MKVKRVDRVELVEEASKDGTRSRIYSHVVLKLIEVLALLTDLLLQLGKPANWVSFLSWARCHSSPAV